MKKEITNPLLPLSVTNSKYYLILFILWPFIAFLVALANYSHKEARKVVYIFIIYYGLTFVNTNQYVDAYRYALELKTNALLPFSDFLKIVGGIYATDTTLDIFEPLVSFIVSRFTGHHSVYFAVWAMIFGFFYLKSISLLYERQRENPGWNSTILMAFFIVILPITAISGVRMWTAGWIFFYAAYHVVLYRDKRYILLALASSLVHWSFLAANVILILYFLAGNRNFIYLPLAIASFILPHLFSPFFHLVSIRLGGGLQTRYEDYSSENYILLRQESHAQASWFLQIGTDMVFYYLLFAIIIIEIKSASISKEEDEKNLFSFLLLYLAFVNFGKVIPSFGERFQTIFLLLATAYIFMRFLKIFRNNINLLIFIGLFPMLLYTAIIFRIGSESINPWIFTPGLGLPFLDPDLSIADLLFY
jgi:hypothetical protein